MAVAMVLVAGCVTTPAVDLSVPLPEAWQGELASGTQQVVLTRWWKAFHDRQLETLVEEALQSNLDIEQAIARLKQAQILADSARGGFLPVFSGNAHTEQDLATRDDYFLTGVNMLWDPGLFGAKDNVLLAGLADVATAQAREQGIRVQVVADVVKVYLDLQTARYRLSQLELIQKLDEEAVRIGNVRHKTHVGDIGELSSLALHVSQVQAEQASVREALNVAARSLAVLLGRNQPDKKWLAGDIHLPEVSAFSFDQVPADLLRTRPDIRLAEASVLKAAADLGISRSALYPRLALEGSLLYSYNLSSHVRAGAAVLDPALGPVIDIPLWDWGVRRARIKADEQVLDAALSGYHKAVLEGIAEVEDALSGLAFRRQHREALKKNLQLRQKHLQRYGVLLAQGLGSRFGEISVQRDVLEASMQFAQAQTSRDYAFIALYKALGGAPLPGAKQQ